MKKIIITLLLIMSSALAQSQISWERYNDNFSYLKNDTVVKKGFDKLKYIPLFKNATISFGGEIREQYQYYDHPNFGDVPPTFSRTFTEQLWHRAMAHTNVELGNKLRVFVQFESTFRFFNPNPLTAEIDENQISLHQAFLDYTFDKNWMVRLGTQEVFYGSHRLFTFREGPNNRLAFDAAIIKYHTDKWKVDAFIATPVLVKQGNFDDESSKDEIAGIYATEKVIPHKLLFDYYFVNYHSDRRKYNYVAGTETRQNYGFRLFSDNSKLNYELEATYQSGKFNGLTISAYGLASDINYKLTSKNNFIIGVASNYMSGDKNPNDSQLNTYNTMFSKPPYGLTAPIGSSNLIDVNPYIKINPIKKLNVFVSSYWMWRQSDKDGTYSPAAIEVRPNPAVLFASTKKEIGNLLALETNYFLNKHFTIGLDASYFFAGDYVKETGRGKNITYMSCRAGYKF